MYHQLNKQCTVVQDTPSVHPVYSYRLYIIFKINKSMR